MVICESKKAKRKRITNPRFLSAEKLRVHVHLSCFECTIIMKIRKFEV